MKKPRRKRILTYTIQLRWTKAEATKWFKNWKRDNLYWGEATLARFLDDVDNEALFCEFILDDKILDPTTVEYFQYIANRL